MDAVGRSTEMTREYIRGVLFLSGLWGISEATLGNALYSAQVPHASVPLTIVGFVILTVARVWFPRPGTATLIASFAMLYKFLNAPFFGCHLLGILLMGACYDVFFHVFRRRAVWLTAGLATYADYAAFALMITYGARYEHWVQGGFSRILQHVGIDGSMAAVACAVLVPLTLSYGEKLRSATPLWSAGRAALIPRALTGVTAGVWVLGIVICWLNYAPRV
jgi:hypothetical protein